MGEIIGFIIGWNLTLEYGMSASVIAQSWSAYLESFISALNKKARFNEYIFGKNIDEVFTINVLSTILVGCITIMLMSGIKQSATFTNCITIWNILLILTFIVAGSFYVDTNNWFKPCEQNQFGTYCDEEQKNSFFGEGLSGILYSTSLVFFSFIGFDAVTCLAEETKNPKRDMVWGLIGTLGIATVLYIAVSLVLTGMVPYTALDPSSPLSDAFLKHNSTFLSGLVSFGALTTTTATTITCLIGQPRIFYRMAMDGLFYKLFENITLSIVISGILCGIIGCFINFETLAKMISAGTLLAYVLVCSGVLILRYEGNMKSSKTISVIVSLFVVFSLIFSFAVSMLIVNKDYVVSDAVSYIIVGGLGIIVFILVCMIFMIHFKYGNIDRSTLGDIYLTPLCPFVPLAGILVNSFMIAALEISSFIRLLVWTIIGLIIYFTYGIRHSKLNNINTNSVDIYKNSLLTTHEPYKFSINNDVESFH